MHRLVGWRDRPRLDGHVGAGQHAAGGERRQVLDVGDLLEPERARHVDGRLDEVFWADRSNPHILHAEHAGERQDACADGSRDAFGGAVDERVDRVHHQAKREHCDQRRDSDRRRRVAPAIAGGDDRKAGENGERGEDVGGEVEGVGLKRRAMRLPADSLERPRAPGVDDDLDQKHADRDEADRRRRFVGPDAAECFHGDAAGKQEQQRRLAERRDVLELAVAVGVLGVGRLVGDPDRHPGDACREKIDAGMERVGDEREAADREADDKLRRRKDQARDERYGGGAFLQRHDGRQSVLTLS